MCCAAEKMQPLVTLVLQPLRVARQLVDTRAMDDSELRRALRTLREHQDEF